jgi:hypothetical protein
MTEGKMMKETMLLLAVLIFVGTQAYAAGDLIVDGKAGIGTTTPSTKLDVRGGISIGRDISLSPAFWSTNQLYMPQNTSLGMQGSYASYWAWNWARTGGSSWALLGGADVNNSTTANSIKLSDSGISFHAEGSYGATAEPLSRMIIKPTGNVGIGTTTPGYKLDIAGTGGNGIVRIWDGSNNNNSIQLGYWTAAQTDIDGLLPGSTVGSLIRGSANGHVVVGLRDNDAQDGFYVLSGGGNYMTDTTYDTVVLLARADGNVGIGTTSPAYKLDVNGTIRGANVSPSDIRYKENIAPVASALAKVEKIQGVSFNWKKGESIGRNFPEGRHYGVIAQEIEKVLPEVVSTDYDGYKSVAYTEIIPVLIEAIKELQKEINELKAGR